MKRSDKMQEYGIRETGQPLWFDMRRNIEAQFAGSFVRPTPRTTKIAAALQTASYQPRCWSATSDFGQPPSPRLTPLQCSYFELAARSVTWDTAAPCEYTTKSCPRSSCTSFSRRRKLNIAIFTWLTWILLRGTRSLRLTMPTPRVQWAILLVRESIFICFD